jgi:hypothetical protein
LPFAAAGLPVTLRKWLQPRHGIPITALFNLNLPSRCWNAALSSPPSTPSKISTSPATTLTPRGLDDSGQVIGGYFRYLGTPACDDAGRLVWHEGGGFLWSSSGGLQRLSFSPKSINHSGQIVGIDYDYDVEIGTTSRVVLYSNGVVQDLGPP